MPERAVVAVAPFRYDIAVARAAFERQGWFHAPGGVTPELMDVVTGQIAELIGTDEHELENWRYPDKKEQFLWDLPDNLDVDDLCRVVADTAGLDVARTVLSERHLKVYSATAPELPTPHKDRSASTVTVGIGIDSPADSRLVLWPESDLTYNPFPTAAEWRETRHPEELPEVVTEGDPMVEIDLQRGDVVLFRGANLYHERRRPACTTVLYLKFNDRSLDPLAEDPRTVVAEHQSGELLRSGVTGEIRVGLSPRVVGVRSDELFPDLGIVESARLIGVDSDVRLSTEEAAVLRRLAADGPSTAHDLDGGIEMAERLTRSGLVLLSPAEPPG